MRNRRRGARTGISSWLSPALTTIFFFIALYIVIQVIMFWWDVEKLIEAEERLCAKILAGDAFLQEQINELTREADDVKDDFQACVDDEVCTKFVELESLAARYQGKYDPKNDLPFLIPNGNHPPTNPLAVTNNDGDIYYVISELDPSPVANNSGLSAGDLLVYDITCTAFLVVRGGIPSLIALTEAGEGESLISDPVGPIMGIKKLVPFQGMNMTQIGDDGLRLEPKIEFSNAGNGVKVLKNPDGPSDTADFRTLVSEVGRVISISEPFQSNTIKLAIGVRHALGIMTRTFSESMNAYAGKQFDFSELKNVLVRAYCPSGTKIISCSCEAVLLNGFDFFPALQDSFVHEFGNRCICLWQMGVNSGPIFFGYQARAGCLKVV